MYNFKNISEEDRCEFVKENLNLKKSKRLQLSQLAVLVVASTRILFEGLQIIQVKCIIYVSIGFNLLI